MQRAVDKVLTNKNSVYKLTYEGLSYVNLLHKYFELRKKRNPKYSLRRLAKDLELTAPHLSYILRGLRGLSRKKLKQQQRFLDFLTKIEESFCKLYQP